MPTSIEVIELACLSIIQALKAGEFSREELEFLLRFFKEIVKMIERKMGIKVYE